MKQFNDKFTVKNSVTDSANSIYKKFLIFGFNLLCLIVMTGIFLSGWRLFQNRNFASDGISISLTVLVLTVFLVYAAAMKIYGALEPGLNPTEGLFFSQLIAVVIGNAVIFAAALLILKKPPSLAALLFVLLSESAWCFLWGKASDKICRKLYVPPKTAVLYENEDYAGSLFKLYRYHRKFRIVKIIKVDKDFGADFERLKDVDVIFIYGVTGTLRDVILKYCIRNGLQFYIHPRLEDILLSGCRTVHVNDTPVKHYDGSSFPARYLVSKRLFDIMLSALGIMIAGPVMLVIAAGIKLYDGGPVFYKQTRLTKEYKQFEILKFRSMVPDAEGDGVVRLACKNDQRVTPIGRVIRATRLDELPQLINIFKGDMTFVGPRPERPELAEQYEEELPEFGLRLRVKAGLTGYAQVYGKYNTTPYNKLQMDLIYISNPSVIEDLRLMLLTAKVLFHSGKHGRSQ